MAPTERRRTAMDFRDEGEVDPWVTEWLESFDAYARIGPWLQDVFAGR